MKQTSFTAHVERAGDKLRVESVGEYSVPDYQPQIRRILRVRTRVLPSGRYRRGGRTECAGLCVHTVLYSTDDASLATLDVTSEYSFSFPADDDALVLLFVPEVEGVGCRLGGPRRITVRATLTLVPHVYSRVQAGEEEDGGLGEKDTVCLTHPLSIRRAELLSQSDLILSDTRPLEAGTELLAFDACPEVSETRMTDGGAEVRGELLCTALLSGEGAVPYTLTHRIPFDTTLPCTADASAEVYAYPTVSSLEARAVSGEGAGTRLLLDVGLELDAEVLTPTRERVVVDAFSLKSPLVARKESIPVTELLGTVRHRQALECSISRSESDSEDATAVIDIGASAHVRSHAREGDRLTVLGDCRVDAALLLGSDDAEGRPDYAATSFASPFEVTVPLPRELPEDAELEIMAQMCDVRGRLEAASLSAEGELCLTVRASRRRMLSLAVGMQESEGSAGPACGECELLAVYPSQRDSLWSIAKRYCVSPERIAEGNALPPESLESADLPSSIDGCVRLLIEK